MFTPETYPRGVLVVLSCHDDASRAFSLGTRRRLHSEQIVWLAGSLPDNGARGHKTQQH